MPLRMTEPVIRAALRDAGEVGRRDLADVTLPGLRLRVTPQGRGTWVLACRDADGRMRRFPLGAWPEVGVAQAREAARTLRVEVRKGVDPVAEARRRRAQAREARQGVGTLAALLDVYGEKVGAGIKSWPKGRRKVELVFHALLKRPLAGMTRVELQAAADAYPKQLQARTAVSALRPVLRWAVPRTAVQPDTVQVASAATKVARDRVLSQDELARLLPALAAEPGGYGGALRMMLLTLARREEVGGTRWRDVDLTAATLRITADRAKNRMEHLVPLSRQAVAQLRAIGPCKPGELVFRTGKGGQLLNWHPPTQRLMRETGTSGWTRHDLRRTGATMLGEMGELPDIIEAALNHVTIRSQVAAIYNRSRYRPQVAVALQRLADALDGIAGNAPGA